jgi:hypothetical protein
MKPVDFDDITIGKYYLIYYPHNYISIALCVEHSNEVHHSENYRSFKDSVPFYQVGARVINGAITIYIGEPEDTYMDNGSLEEAFEMSDDEIHEHILMETI